MSHAALNTVAILGNTIAITFVSVAVVRLSRDFARLATRGPSDWDSCSLCNRRAITYINGQPFCDEHFPAGFGVVLRRMAIAMGADPEQVQGMSERMLRELLERMVNDDGNDDGSPLL